MNAISNAIGWLIVTAFAITFVVTIAGIIGFFHIEKRYLAQLFNKLILEVLAAALFLFYSGVRAAEPPYNGEWKGTIYWSDAYARTLFNYGNTEAGFQPINPRSEGSLYFYRSKSGVYKGFSTWETKNGETAYSKLAVIQSDFVFDPSGNLRSVCSKTAFRTPLRQFSYGPFTRYRMQFDYVSDGRMVGKMIVYDLEGQERDVGEVVLERE